MTVFYDHQAFSLQDYGGITRIYTELLKGINKTEHCAYLSLIYSKNAYLEEANITFPFFLKNVPGIHRRSLTYLINNIQNKFQLSRGRFDIYHPTYYSFDLIKYAHKKPVIVTFHDMTHEVLSCKFRELAADTKLIEQKALIVRKASHVIAVSEHTKKDVINHYGIAPEKIQVIHLGSSLLHTSSVNAANNKSRYLLFVGNRALYKNFIPFITSIAQLLIDNNLYLICAGGKKFNATETNLFAQLSLQNHVVHKVVNNDETLTQLYANAIAFVFPSLYEGFGIPILEAFSCGCPCLLSNTSSLPEVAGDAAIYFDPYDGESMYEAVAHVVFNEPLREELVIKGRLRLKNFSWDQHVTQTIDLYKNVLG